MELVIEPGEACNWGRADFRGLVTLETYVRFRQQVVIGTRASEGRRVASDAVQLRG